MVQEQVSGSFEIGRFLLLPDRKLYGVLVTAENKPGVLGEISAIPASHNANIIYLAFSAPSPTQKTATGLAFLDLTNADVSPEDIAKEAKKSKSITEIKIIYPPLEGFIADTLSNPLLLNGDRTIVMRLQGYKGIIADIRKHFGTAGEAFLYYVGFDSGVEYAKSHLEMATKLGLTEPTKIFKLISATLFTCVGYGKMKVLRLTTKPPKAFIRIYNSFECELGIGTGKPFSHLVRGMIAGTLTTLLNTKMKATETKCIARRDPYCEFKIKPERPDSGSKQTKTSN